MKSKIVSISAISAGLVALFLLIGAYFEMADVFTVVISSVLVMLPLYHKSYKGSLLSYLAGGVIAFICSGFNILSLVFPAYFTFFGIYPIIKNFLVEKGFNKYAGFIFGLIWMIAVAIGLYFYYTAFMGAVINGLPQWLTDHILLFVILLSIVFFVVFDRFVVVVRKVMDYYLRRIIK